MCTVLAGYTPVPDNVRWSSLTRIIRGNVMARRLVPLLSKGLQVLEGLSRRIDKWIWDVHADSFTRAIAALQITKLCCLTG